MKKIKNFLNGLTFFTIIIAMIFLLGYCFLDVLYDIGYIS